MNDPLSPFIKYFEKPEHQAFLLEGGSPAALLVHGFPGSPAETRPLGLALQKAGWSVEGILLPGFGAQMNTLFERRHTEWADAIVHRLHHLKSTHHPVLLAGFSMGASLALQASANEKPDALALLAPFWKLEGRLWSLLPLMRVIFPRIHPFRLVKMDFSDPQLRKGMQEFIPGIDLDDPEVRQGMRDFAIPIGIIDEIRKAGLAAWQAAHRANLPVLVLQGATDELVKPHLTRQLLQRIPGPIRYAELNAAHDLLDPNRPAWAAVETAITQFASELCMVSSGALPLA
jgi:carboxylesterase